MKILILLLCSVAVAGATPFLNCDPVPVTDPSAPITGYVISGLPGGDISTIAWTNTSSYQLHYDLGAVPAGTYTVTAVAVNKVGDSPSSAPLTFSLTKPAAPTHLRINP